jgi:hypothetical protein
MWERFRGVDHERPRSGEVTSQSWNAWLIGGRDMYRDGQNEKMTWILPVEASKTGVGS